MNREIKFRAYGKNSKEFLDNGCGFSLKEMQNIEDIDSWDIMQFAGFKDKNKKEIYEKDIVKVVAMHSFDEGDIAGKEVDFVEFIPEVGVFGFFGREGLRGLGVRDLHKRYKAHFLEFEIIGNIYENPELLNN